MKHEVYTFFLSDSEDSGYLFLVALCAIRAFSEFVSLEGVLNG